MIVFSPHNSLNLLLLPKAPLVFIVYISCQKYVPIDLANLSKVIANEAMQSLRISKRLLPRMAPRNDGLSEYIFDNHYKCLQRNNLFKSDNPKRKR